MFKTAQAWFNALVAWVTGSVETSGKEAVEDMLDEPTMRAFWNVMDAYAKSGRHSRGNFPQVLRGGGHPSDRSDQLQEKDANGNPVPGGRPEFVPGLPAGLDYEIHEWVGPNDTKGWWLIVYAEEGDGSKWRMRIPNDGEPEGWEEIVEVI